MRIDIQHAALSAAAVNLHSSTNGPRKGTKIAAVTHDMRTHIEFKVSREKMSRVGLFGGY